MKSHEKIAVECNAEYEKLRVIKYGRDNGYHVTSDYHPSSDCIDLSDGGHCDKEWFLRYGYKVMPYATFAANYLTTQQPNKKELPTNRWCVENTPTTREAIREFGKTYKGATTLSHCWQMDCSYYGVTGDGKLSAKDITWGQLLSEEEFFELVSRETNKPKSIQVLPSKWCIKNTDEAKPFIREWCRLLKSVRIATATEDFYYPLEAPTLTSLLDPVENRSTIPPNHTVLPLEQFKTLVLEPLKVTKEKSNDKFIEGNWYLIGGAVYKFSNLDSNKWFYSERLSKTYYSNSRDWVDVPNVYKAATTDEVNTLLLNYAKNEYEIGDQVKCVFDGDLFVINSFDKASIEIACWARDKYNQSICLYRDGKWAEVIVVPKPKVEIRNHIAQSNFGYHTTFDFPSLYERPRALLDRTSYNNRHKDLLTEDKPLLIREQKEQEPKILLLN